MRVVVSQFKGALPRLEPTLIKQEYSQLAVNTDISGGNILPFHENVEEYRLTDPIQDYRTIYKYEKSGSYKWLFWTGAYTYVTKDPIYNDDYNRTIYVNSLMTTPRIFDSTQITDHGTVTDAMSYALGVATPVTTATRITASGSPTGIPESRAYTITYTRKWADNKRDEGAISAPLTTSAGAKFVDVTPNQSVVVSPIPDAPAGYGINEINIYRSATSTSDTAYQFVRSFDIAAAKAGGVANVVWNAGSSTFTFEDTVKTLDLGDLNSSEFYTPPPAGLTGIISLNNGILAGFKDNDVYFSEPNQCHAWPSSYRIAIDRKIVGLGTFGNTVVVCTDAEPHVISMTDPANPVAYPIKEAAPCINSEAIVSYRNAVIYPSYIGFIRIGTAGFENLTQDYMTSQNMIDLNLGSIFAVGLDDMYYGFYYASGQRGLITLDLAHPDRGIIKANAECTAAYVDKVTSTIYVVVFPTKYKRAIVKFNKSTAPVRFAWKSKKFVASDDSTNLSAARIRFREADAALDKTYDFDDLEDPHDGREFNFFPLNGPFVASLDEWAFVAFVLYCDGEPIFSKMVHDDKPFRLPAGKTGHYYEFEISGYQPLYEVSIATSMTELSRLSEVS